MFTVRFIERQRQISHVQVLSILGVNDSGYEICKFDVCYGLRHFNFRDTAEVQQFHESDITMETETPESGESIERLHRFCS